MWEKTYTHQIDHLCFICTEKLSYLDSSALTHISNFSVGGTTLIPVQSCWLKSMHGYVIIPLWFKKGNCSSIFFWIHQVDCLLPNKTLLYKVSHDDVSFLQRNIVNIHCTRSYDRIYFLDPKINLWDCVLGSFYGWRIKSSQRISQCQRVQRRPVV